MSPSFGKSLALAACLALAATPAASVPDPRRCSFDAVGVGDNSGAVVGGSTGGFHIALRDVNNAPIATGWVGLGFAGSGVRVYAAQNPGVTVDVANQMVTQRFVSGTADFVLRTGGFSNASTVAVVGDGVVLGLARWRSTDIDAADGKTGLGDVTYFAARYLSASTAPECNFDRSASGSPGLGDFTILSSEFLSGVAGTYAW